MDIEDAFTSDAINASDTNVEGEVDQRLRDLIVQIYASNELPPPNDNDVNIAALCFVAGRTYQYDLSGESTALINIPMTPDEVYSYISYLTQRSS
jgi:hypothetical protein